MFFYNMFGRRHHNPNGHDHWNRPEGPSCPSCSQSPPGNGNCPFCPPPPPRKKPGCGPCGLHECPRKR